MEKTSPQQFTWFMGTPFIFLSKVDFVNISPWKIAAETLIKIMEAIVTDQKISCHASEFTLAIAHVKANNTITHIKLINNLGVVLKW